MIGDRISYKDHGNRTTIIVSTKIDKWKETMLLTWLIGWTVCTGAFLYYWMFGDFGKDETVMLAVMSAFMLFFEVRIGRAFLWRKWGMEYMQIDEDRMTVKRSILSYGKMKTYRLHQVKDIQAIEQSPKAITKAMNDSFWVIGQGVVSFMYNGKEIRFGAQLENDEAKKLAKTVKKLISQYKRND